MYITSILKRQHSKEESLTPDGFPLNLILLESAITLSHQEFLHLDSVTKVPFM